jgi:hypothetical protein
MSKISRAKLRGKPLDNDCRRAYRTTNEYGKEDNRVFCYGRIDYTTEELLPKCKECQANVKNAKPIKEMVGEG